MAKKCQSRKKNGESCGADPQSGKGLCVFHDPAKAEDGRRARQAGGINRSRVATVLPPETPDDPLRSTTDVSTLLSESINQVQRGQLDPRMANAVGYLACETSNRIQLRWRKLIWASVVEQLLRLPVTMTSIMCAGFSLRGDRRRSCHWIHPVHTRPILGGTHWQANISGAATQFSRRPNVVHASWRPRKDRR